MEAERTVTDLILPRRQFLKTLSGIIAAPAIVRADSLMKVVAPKPHITTLRIGLPQGNWGEIYDWQYIVRLSNIVGSPPPTLRRR